MEIPKIDMEKVWLITLTAQVNDLLILASGIDKDGLISAINSVVPENRGTLMYKFMLRTLEFKNDIDEEIQKNQKTDDNQTSLNFNE